MSTAPNTLSLVGPTEPILFTPAAPVTDIEAQVRPHVAAMRDLMAASSGIGLAAPQVGVPFRFFVMKKFEGSASVVINPVILETSGHNISKVEGCLSFPHRTAYVSRRETIVAEWLTMHGEMKRRALTGLGARVFQHETDHLNGVCIFPKPEAST